jgi:hypothetical protein
VNDAARIRALKRAVTSLLLLGFLAFLVKGADGPADPHLAPAPPTAPAVSATP